MASPISRSFNATSMQVSHESALSMYRENVKKTKNSEMQFGFGKHLIMLARSMRENEHIEFTMEKDELTKSYIQEGLNWIKQASKNGNSDASFYLAVCHEKGENMRVSRVKAYNYFLMAARAGHSDAAHKVAMYLEEGDVVKKDSGKAFLYYKKSGTAGSSPAALRIALCYFFGTLGTNINFKEGLNWLKMATNKVDRKSVEAMYTLGLLYAGEMPNVNPPSSFHITADTVAEAGELFLKSAKLGFVPSMKKVAEGFEKGGYGFSPNREQAIYWYKLAAEVDPESGLSLAALYYDWAMEGTLEPGKDEEAFALADRAAQVGIAAGQFAVGYFYEKGFGVPVDTIISRQWYEVAAKNGDERAIHRVYPDGHRPTLNKKSSKESCIIS